MKVVQTTCDFGEPQRDRAAATGRADRIVQQLTGRSRAEIRGLFDHDCVCVNGTICHLPQQQLTSGDVVQVKYDPHRRYHEKPQSKSDPAFELIYEDAEVLVVNKSPHVFTVPTPGDKGKTLIAALEAHVNRQSPAGKPRRLHVVQRLDRGVSGVLVFAKTASAAATIREQFAAHKPRRIYLAIATGSFERKRGTFRSHMATGRNLQRYSTKNPDAGELAITHFEVISEAHEATLVRVQLETGRRNQIRVHFAEAGHPLLGDKRYGAGPHPRWKARRIALHAAELSFIHPTTGKLMEFRTDLPREFEPFARSGQHQSAKGRSSAANRKGPPRANRAAKP